MGGFRGLRGVGGGGRGLGMGWAGVFEGFTGVSGGFMGDLLKLKRPAANWHKIRSF